MTPGRAALLKLPTSEVKRRTGAPLSTIKSWRSGVRTPSATHRLAMARWFGVALDAWDETKDANVDAAPFRLLLVRVSE